MKLVVIIPALNEEKTIQTVINNIPKNIPSITEQEVIVINDGSTDQTKSLAQDAGAFVVSHGKPQGVGAAFHTGLETALRHNADLIVTLDGDGQFNPQDIPALIQPILSGLASFASATRFADPKLIPHMPAIKIWGNQMVTNLVNFLTGKKFTDCSCGFRAYTRDAALRLILFGKFTYTQETLIDLAYKNISMNEVPLSIRGQRQHGHSRVAHNIFRYAIKSAAIMFRTARDYRPFYFFGIPGLIITGLGLVGALFLLIHFLSTGVTAPFRSLVTISGALIITGVVLFSLSMLADMQHRNRLLLEELLYLTRQKTYQKK